MQHLGQCVTHWHVNTRDSWTIEFQGALSFTIILEVSSKYLRWSRDAQNLSKSLLKRGFLLYFKAIYKIRFVCLEICTWVSSSSFFIYFKIPINFTRRKYCNIGIIVGECILSKQYFINVRRISKCHILPFICYVRFDAQTWKTMVLAEMKSGSWLSEMYAIS